MKLLYLRTGHSEGMPMPGSREYRQVGSDLPVFLPQHLIDRIQQVLKAGACLGTDSNTGLLANKFVSC